MITLTTKPALRDACERARAAGRTVGLVATMGSLHAGHGSLVRAARADCDVVVATVFVNPLQFGAHEDLAGYPRDLAADQALLDAEGADVVFAPPVEEMYPDAIRTTVHVHDLTDGLCGAARPQHFDGVTTVVTKLLALVGACRAYFGRKDAQQLAVVRRMTADLDLPAQIIGCPIVRDPDGLALSSRNTYLSGSQRQAATILSRALYVGAESVVHGERDPGVLVRSIADTVASQPSVALDYIDVRGAADLATIEKLDGDVLVALAAQVGPARLIDNMTLTIRGDEVRGDLGVVAATRSER